MSEPVTVIDERGAWRVRPGRWARAFNAGPVWMYRLRLGWPIPRSMVMITHRGRKTGKRRHTCLEVAHRDEVTGEIVVFSSRGERADWYRNLVAAPAVGVQVGRRRYKPRQRFLPPDEALAVLREYAGRRLAVAKRLAPGGTDEELQPSPNGRAWWRSAGEQRAMSDERPVIDERADLNLVQLNNSYQRFSRVGGK